MPFLKEKSSYIKTRSRVIENNSKRYGLRHTIFFSGRARYTGEWKNDKQDGQGFVEKKCQDECILYEGGWKNGCRHGFGIVAIRQNNIYRLLAASNWKNGKMQGEGKESGQNMSCFSYTDNSYYMGELKQSRRHGEGQMWYSDGAFYIGDWQNDKKHGQGMFVRCDGNRYEGTWLNDQKNGKGRFFFLNTGQVQEGIWCEDVCIYATIADIPYRQSALSPTQYPVRSVELSNYEEVSQAGEARALEVYNYSPLKYDAKPEKTNSLAKCMGF